jgi:hypothetical protein
MTAALIRTSPVPRGLDRPGLAGLLSGFAFVARQRTILGAISLDLFAVLVGGAVALMPIFAKDILNAGPAGLGLLRAAPAIGALVTSLWLAQRPLRPPVGRRMFAALIVFGVATLLFAWSGSIALSCLALAVVGAADVVSVVIRSSLVQLRTPDDMRGRVSAVNSLCVGTSNQLGDFRAGAVAALFGVVPAAILGGLGSIAVALLWMRLFPELRRLQKLGYQQAIVTNKPSDFVAPILDALGISDCFVLWLGGNCVPVKKPSPEPLLHACRELGVSPARTLMVGDSENDVLAAQAAGMKVVGLTYGYNYGRPIADSHPDWVFEQFSQLDALLV